MSRTESVAIQVHPRDEQEQINLMQQFHWSLLNSQEIKTIDNHLELRGTGIYQVTNSEHYVKLAFSRALDLPNLREVKRIEQEFHGLRSPEYPKLFPGHFLLWLVATFVYGVGVVAWLAYYFLRYAPRSVAANQLTAANARRRQELLTDLSRFD